MPSRVGYRAGVAQEPYTTWDAGKDEVQVDYKQLGDSSHPPSCFSGPKGALLKVLLGATLFLLGIIIGFVIRRSVHHSGTDGGKCPAAGFKGYSRILSDSLSHKISASNIEEYLKNYTAKVHITGTGENIVLGNTLRYQLESFGLEVKEATYRVLLSYPIWENPGFVSLLNGTGTEVFRSHHPGPAYQPDVTVQYNAYSPNGTVEGDVVYANYGEEKDFRTLQEKGVSCKNNIVIMKYGRIFRGLKVKNAEKCGAIGVILYSDPSDVTALHHTSVDVYPNTWFLPRGAAQSGSILPEIDGDPLTPGLPSTTYMHGIKQDEAGLPTVPTYPVGWGDAEELMKHMTGASGGNDFEGSLHANVTYKIGPGYSSPREGWKIRLEVNTELQQNPIRNVIGVIKGDVEPDRYVIVGCHYDAWTFGGVDPSGGTAILTEVARAFSQLVESGWKPHRTLIFAHFDAEEQGLIGSYEWVEEHEKELSERTVIYINLDGAIRGNWSMDVQASPLLQDLIFDVMKMFQSPRNKESVYKEWLRNLWQDQKPVLRPITGGSDHAPFVFMLGVPALWPRYYHDMRDHDSISYPAYHSPLDTFEYVKRFIDPEFKSHEVYSKVVAELVLQLCTRPKLPYSTLPFAALLEVLSDNLKATISPPPHAAKYLDQLEYAVGNFSIIAAEFQNRLEEVDEKNVLEVRQYNDRLLRLQQAFIYSPGLPNRPMFRNLLFAPSAVDSSGGPILTGIYDAFKIYSVSDEQSKQESWAEVERQISIVTVAVQSAIAILHEGVLTRTVL